VDHLGLRYPSRAPSAVSFFEPGTAKEEAQHRNRVGTLSAGAAQSKVEGRTQEEQPFDFIRMADLRLMKACLNPFEMN